MQILVVVANIQTRTLKTEGGWVDTEGTKYFDMTAVKTHMRHLNLEIPRNWREL